MVDFYIDMDETIAGFEAHRMQRMQEVMPSWKYILFKTPANTESTDYVFVLQSWDHLNELLSFTTTV